MIIGALLPSGFTDFNSGRDQRDHCLGTSCGGFGLQRSFSALFNDGLSPFCLFGDRGGRDTDDQEPAVGLCLVGFCQFGGLDVLQDLRVQPVGFFRAGREPNGDGVVSTKG